MSVKAQPPASHLGVLQMRPRVALECCETFADFDQPQTHGLTDRRMRQSTIDHRLQRLPTGQAGDLIRRQDAVAILDGRWHGALFLDL
jgi:hypothetical protein